MGRGAGVGAAVGPVLAAAAATGSVAGGAVARRLPTASPIIPITIATSTATANGGQRLPPPTRAIANSACSGARPCRSPGSGLASPGRSADPFIAGR